MVAKSCTTKGILDGLKHFKTLEIMGCLPPINWCRISQSTVCNHVFQLYHCHDSNYLYQLDHHYSYHHYPAISRLYNCHQEYRIIISSALPWISIMTIGVCNQSIKMHFIICNNSKDNSLIQNLIIFQLHDSFRQLGWASTASSPCPSVWSSVVMFTLEPRRTKKHCMDVL